MDAPSFVELATTRSRAEFVTTCSFPFLVGKVTLHEPLQPQRALGFEDGATLAILRAKLEKGAPINEPMVLAVRKVQDTFPDMITVGRTRNNDLVLTDVQVSKFHAYFRVHGQDVELLDAGSINGTRVGESPLPPKGPGHLVRVGDRVRFGHLEFIFLDAGACWDTIRNWSYTVGVR
jgi:hypothetical protein